jgi:two-component system, OmpR family, copper resistance phosphate regulon response regulator CusR
LFGLYPSKAHHRAPPFLEGLLYLSPCQSELLRMNILVIEDEHKVAAFLKNGLEEQGHCVDLAYDGYTGEKLALNNEYEIVLLDVIIPVMNGIELCKKIKAAKADLPILMLTALGTTDDKVAGFDSGADDYLVKPFEFKELLARIKALTKRIHAKVELVQPATILTVGDLQLDIDKKVAFRGGKVIQLTAKEFALLEYLMRNKGRVVSRPDIAEHVWDVSFDTGTNVVEVYVNILRRKIDKDFSNKLIQTRIGLGYVMQES